MKQIYILIGPKGSGKTYIGDLIEKETDIFFLEIEALFLQMRDKKNSDSEKYIQSVSELVEQKILENLETNNSLIFESTGTASQFKELVENLKNQDIKVKLINISAPLEECFKRVKNRDQDKHMSLSDEIIEIINEQSVREQYPYDLKINNQDISDEEIIKKFKRVI